MTRGRLLYCLAEHTGVNVGHDERLLYNGSAKATYCLKNITNAGIFFKEKPAPVLSIMPQAGKPPPPPGGGISSSSLIYALKSFSALISKHTNDVSRS